MHGTICKNSAEFFLFMFATEISNHPAKARTLQAATCFGERFAASTSVSRRRRLSPSFRLFIRCRRLNAF